MVEWYRGATCPECGEDDWEVEYEGKDYVIEKCKKCGMKRRRAT